VCIIVLGVVGFGYLNKVMGNKNALTRTEDKFLNKVNVSKGLSTAENFDKNVINIIIFGIDRDATRAESAEIFRPDTIVLTSINLETKSITMTSIPRDTYVPLYGNGGKTKINACMYYGTIYGKKDNDFDNEIDCLMQTVSALFGGVPIDYYFGVDMDTVVNVVDVMGGVEFDVPYDIYYQHKIKIKKGLQVLNGYDFLFLARDRENAGSDIERTAMQQKMLKSMFDQLKTSNKLMTLPKIYNSLKDKIYTNMSFEQIVSLAASAKGIDVNNIKTYTFPGYYGSRDSISYWIINQAGRVSLIKELFGINAAVWPQEVLRE
jgi:LCP family protein required for cell wall assembly